jgi:hypothetical protein
VIERFFGSVKCEHLYREEIADGRSSSEGPGPQPRG